MSMTALIAVLGRARLKLPMQAPAHFPSTGPILTSCSDRVGHSNLAPFTNRPTRVLEIEDTHQHEARIQGSELIKLGC